MTVHVVSVNQRAFRLQWCPKCCFHRPPRTSHCPWCNICVEVSEPPLLPTYLLTRPLDLTRTQSFVLCCPGVGMRVLHDW